MAEPIDFRLGQINLGRSKASSIDLVEYVTRNKIPITFVQEQYFKGNILGGGGGSLSVVETGVRFLYDRDHVYNLYY
jgi:hypothetical protein